MCSCLHGDETPRYFSECLLHRFRCRRNLLFQNDFARFIQNTVERPAISQIQTDRQLLLLENFVTECLHSANLLHRRSPLLCLEHVEHWERIASRWRPAFSSHLINVESLTTSAVSRVFSLLFYQNSGTLLGRRMKCVFFCPSVHRCHPNRLSPFTIIDSVLPTKHL